MIVVALQTSVNGLVPLRLYVLFRSPPGRVHTNNAIGSLCETFILTFADNALPSILYAVKFALKLPGNKYVYATGDTVDVFPSPNCHKRVLALLVEVSVKSTVCG